MKYVWLFFVSIILYSAVLSGQVVISEFIPDPSDPLDSEWIELFNLSDQIIDLSAWSLCDLVGCADISDINIGPSEFLIVCQDITSFKAFYDLDDGSIIEVDGWRALNNGGDAIVLRDNQGHTVDSVFYQSGNGNNISWERISYDAPGYDPANWHQSLDPEGSTPLAENSVAGGFATDVRLNLTDKLFSPGCDCPDDQLAIEIDLPRDCLVSLYVYDLEGRMIGTIAEEKAVSATVIYYNGHDDAGIFLDVGMYILLAEVDGECSYSQKLVFGVAKK